MATNKNVSVSWMEGKVEKIVTECAPVTMNDLQSVGNIRDRLALSFLFGEVPAELSKAVKSGDLKKVLPSIGKADADSIRKLCAVTPAAIRRAFNARELSKRTKPTLDGLKRLIHQPSQNTAQRTDWSAVVVTLVAAMGDDAAMGAVDAATWDKIVELKKKAAA